MEITKNLPVTIVVIDTNRRLCSFGCPFWGSMGYCERYKHELMCRQRSKFCLEEFGI